MNTVTPGWKTSEFWLTVVHQLPTLLAVLLGASNPVTIAIGAASALGASIYSASRSHVKATALEVAAAAVPGVVAALDSAVANAPK